jgi:hypothetical protein
MTAASEQKVVVYGGKTYAERSDKGARGSCAGCAFDGGGAICHKTAAFHGLARKAFGGDCYANRVIYVEAS